MASSGEGWSWRLPHWSWREYRLPYAALAVVHILVTLVFLLDRASGTDAALTGLPLDDSWIHLVYARAFSQFDGFAYNPGVQECGFSSPLWVVLLSPVVRLAPLWGGNVVFGVKAVGLAAAWATSAMAWRLTARLTGRRNAAWVVGVLVACEPSLAFAGVSGTEVMLAAGTVMYVLWSLSERRLLGVALGLALCPLARPENMVFWCPAAVLFALILRDRRGRPTDWPLGFLPSLLAIGGWAAFCLAACGRPLPNTYYAKHLAAEGPFDLHNLRLLLGDLVLDLPWMAIGGGAVLFLAGAFVLLRPPDRPRTTTDLLLRGLVVVYPVIFILAIGRVHRFPQPAFYWARYFLPVVPILAVPIGIAIADLGGRAVRQLRAGDFGTARRIAFFIAAILLCAAPFLRLPGRTLALADRFSENCENIREMNVALGLWARDHVPEGRWIALSDAGAIRYFSDRPAVDLAGLNDHRVLQGDAERVLAEKAPRYWIVFPSWLPERVAAERGLRPVHSVRARNYTICDCPQDEIVVYETAMTPAGGDG